jgi:trigger factor
VPLKLVVQTYGPQVRSEVMGDAVQKAFTNAVKEANLKVAGYPQIERKNDFEFSATFEIYPEVKVGDLAAPASSGRPRKWTMPRSTRRSRSCASSAPASRPWQRAAKDGDRLTVDFRGTIDGQPFQGGEAADFVFGLGEGPHAAGVRDRGSRHVGRREQGPSISISPPTTMARKLLGKKRPSP